MTTRGDPTKRARATAPNFAEMSAEAARALLAGSHMGRLAFSFHDRVDIQPINYVFEDGWIIARTQVGGKLSTLAHHPWCAFEVDAVRGLFDWDSVVARGSFHILDPELGSADRYESALAALRRLIPDTFSAADPTPQRSIIVGVYVEEITGRTARPAA